MRKTTITRTICGVDIRLMFWEDGEVYIVVGAIGEPKKQFGFSSHDVLSYRDGKTMTAVLKTKQRTGWIWNRRTTTYRERGLILGEVIMKMIKLLETKAVRIDTYEPIIKCD